MLWIGRRIGQGFYINDKRLELVRAGMNHCELKDENGVWYRFEVTNHIVFEGCKVILSATDYDYAKFLFKAPESVEIYRDELYGRLQRSNRRSSDRMGQDGKRGYNQTRVSDSTAGQDEGFNG